MKRTAKIKIFSAFAILLVLFIVNGITIYWMPDHTMEATILKDEKVWINKFAFGDYFLGYKLPGISKIQRGDLVYMIDPSQNDRPLYKRDRIIARVIALPFDVFALKSRTIYINQQIFEDPATVQHGYRIVAKDGIKLDSSFFAKYNLKEVINEGRKSDLHEKYFKAYNFEEMPIDIWEAPMTAEKAKIVEEDSLVSYIRFVRSNVPGRYLKIWPYGTYWTWNHWNTYPDFQVPGKNLTINLSFRSIEGYDELISKYENNKLDVTLNNEIYINGQLTNSYIVKKNYYLVLSDNRDRFYDSRTWGLVPEEYIIGKVLGKK